MNCPLLSRTTTSVVTSSTTEVKSGVRRWSCCPCAATPARVSISRDAHVACRPVIACIAIDYKAGLLVPGLVGLQSRVIAVRQVAPGRLRRTRRPPETASPAIAATAAPAPEHLAEGREHRLVAFESRAHLIIGHPVVRVQALGLFAQRL